MTWNPDGSGNKPHVPTAAQLAELATLQAATATAKTTLDAIIAPLTGTLPVAVAAYQNAVAAQKQYELYIYGGQKPGIIDEGGQNVT